MLSTDTTSDTSRTASWRRPEFFLIILALMLRMVFMLVGHTYRFPATNNHFNFGYETGSIAGAIARGEGFGSPFFRPSGPTAWIGPIYPYTLAGIFKIFGIFTDASAIAILTLNSVFAALTCWTIFEIGKQISGRKAGFIAAASWAVVPFFFRYAITWVWDPPVSAFLLSLGVLLVLRIENNDWRSWSRLGVLAGVSTLVNPALTTLFPVLIAWAAWKLRSRPLAALKAAAMAVMIMGACMSPWLVRNRLVFGQWVFIRSNAAFEFSLGNFPGSPGAPFSGAHPAVNQRVFDEYLRLGEIQFNKVKGQQANDWVRTHPRDFVELSLKRVADFWDGQELHYEPTDDPWKPWMVASESALALMGLLLAGMRRNRKVAPIALMMLLYPLPYYVVYTNPRYRHALEPLMVVLMGYLIATAWEAFTERSEPAGMKTLPAAK